ncbi:MAG: hypothetical protein ABSG37_08680 [Candidatus Limnocylindrales bacterium]|jgi:hypothetical protein
MKRTGSATVARSIEPWPRSCKSSPRRPGPNALETADYWISIGLTIGLERPHQARRLLELIEAEEAERSALVEDAAAFLDEALA